MDSLKFVLRLNAASCVSFGLLFVVLPKAVAMFLGQIPAPVIVAVGIGLLGNGAHLIHASRRAETRENEIIWFSLGDFAWWLTTLALIVANIWITKPWGILLAVIVGALVAGLGVAQLWIYGRKSHENTHKKHFKAVTNSWMALPLWVKIWLLVLNGIFLAAIAMLPDRAAEVTLVAYLATTPLLAGQIGYDGGLRRILGMGHLVPWSPFLLWLMSLPNPSPYTTVLSIAVTICLCLDIFDVWRFIKGDRAIVGKKKTVSKTDGGPDRLRKIRTSN